MNWILPPGLFSVLINGSLGLAAVGAIVLLVLFIRDLRTKSTW